ncbi:Calcium-dependent lipid-binding (CaLB domain) family protein [Striga hermonthica]|uniref:Calcium-dependent lipid-binding (CaLB domain) family protein n=1 Tax=Striga hermonthica TaxID=68872 RepID=A0A9N7RHL1_STRHE|nr:Calcium-dependent lipid-binding (CaLB domain) family protein [Striga hermonthica]
MGSRYEVEVTVTSAENLKNVNWRHGKLRPYAVVWVDPAAAKRSTRVDEDGDISPRWGDRLLIPFDSPIEDSSLCVDVVHADAAEDTKPLIGSARLRLRDLVEDAGLGVAAERRLELKRPSGRPQGKLEVRVSVREPPRYPAPDPYHAPPYGVPPPGTREYYSPPPYGGPYGGPPAYAAPPAGYPGAYGAPPPIYGQPAYGQGGYYVQDGYSGQQQGYGEEHKKSKFGGMGTGLAVGAVAGALGGLALAEGVDALEDKIADDVADRVEDDLGYDGDDF